MHLRRLVPVGLLAVVLAVTPAQAGPGRLPTGTSGSATPNVTPLAHLPTLGAGVSGAFLDPRTYVLSVADPVWNETSLPLTTAGGGLAVLDTSDPADPQVQALLPVPNYQNEDVAVSSRRRFAVLSQDGGVGTGGRVLLVGLTDPSFPQLLGAAVLPEGYGHTSTLVDGDRYLWVSGGEQVLVVDVRDLAAPKVLGTFPSPAGLQGPSGFRGIHDVEVDRFGDLTVYGSGGTAVHRLGRGPLRPELVARIPHAANTIERNGLIHHGGTRLDEDTWLITEEDYAAGCGSQGGDQDGSLQVWRLDRPTRTLRYVTEWDAPDDADDSGPLTQADYCSSHWFTVNTNHVVADAWYGAGVRFLDVSDPRRPRPIGVWAGDSTTASQAVFVPGRPDLVYVADYRRGLDVVQLAKGGKGARTVTPADQRPVGTPTLQAGWLDRARALEPDPKWGWSCGTPAPAHHARP